MEAPIPQPGELIAGRLLVEKVLGKGGMGVVLAARHTELGERVAVKMLRLPSSVEGRVDERAVERLRREARAAAKLRGEHVVRVMDVGTLESGVPYIVMEYVAGRTVAQAREATGRVAVETAVDWVLQGCEALAEAHGLGVVHRDIKPSNLLLTTRPDGSPLIKLLDFGIAKSLPLAPTTLTETGGFLGSPLYASPEQVRDARVVDHRTDIWSMGVVLYELVTGSLPFPSYTATAALASLVADPPVAPRTVVPELPLALERVLLRCLEKDPKARFGSVAELARALEPLGSSAAAGATERVQRILSQVGKFPSEPPPDVDASSTRVASQDESLNASRTASVVLEARIDGPRAARKLKVWWAIAAAGMALAAGAVIWKSAGRAPALEAPRPVAAPIEIVSPASVAGQQAPQPSSVVQEPSSARQAPSASAGPGVQVPSSPAPTRTESSKKPHSAAPPAASAAAPPTTAAPASPSVAAKELDVEDFGPRK